MSVAARKYFEPGPLPVLKNRIDPARLAFDLDGVFADTLHLFLEIARRDFRVHGIRYEDITCYDLEACLDMDPGIIEAVLQQILEGTHTYPLKPMEDAPRVILRMLQEYPPVLFVTARADPRPVQRWMEGLFGKKAQDIEIVATGTYDNKAGVLLDYDRTYFLEDRLETCFALDAAGVTPIVYRQPWNRAPHPFAEVGSWQEVLSLVAG